MATQRRRPLDAELVARGLAANVAEARALIDERRVQVAGALAERATRRVAAFEPVLIVELPPRFVSRAGFKLEAALDRFEVDVRGRVALDVGSSTGGFTDCLLAHGAVQVHAVDVGTNQLHERLVGDTRVVVRERTDIRSVSRSELRETCDLVTVDVSFISLAGLADHLVSLAGPTGELVVLVKPQFEATRQEADRTSGVISDPAIWQRSLTRTNDAFGEAGAGMMGAMVSPLRGTAGNTEFLCHMLIGARNDAADECIQHALEQAQ